MEPIWSIWVLVEILTPIGCFYHHHLPNHHRSSAPTSEKHLYDFQGRRCHRFPQLDPPWGGGDVTSDGWTWMCRIFFLKTGTPGRCITPYIPDIYKSVIVIHPGNLTWNLKMMVSYIKWWVFPKFGWWKIFWKTPIKIRWVGRFYNSIYTWHLYKSVLRIVITHWSYNHWDS